MPSNKCSSRGSDTIILSSDSSAPQIPGHVKNQREKACRYSNTIRLVHWHLSRQARTTFKKQLTKWMSSYTYMTYCLWCHSSLCIFSTPLEGAVALWVLSPKNVFIPIHTHTHAHAHCRHTQVWSNTFRHLSQVMALCVLCVEVDHNKPLIKTNFQYLPGHKKLYCSCNNEEILTVPGDRIASFFGRVKSELQ